MKKLLLLCFLAGIFVLASAAVYAQDSYPINDDLYVNDMAGILSAETEASLRAMLADLKADFDIEFTVLTIRTVSSYASGASIESFATGLFNFWGVGDVTRNDGVLIVVAVDDRKVRIELGSGYASSMDSAMQTVLDENTLPYFRNGNYDHGVFYGAQAIIREITGTTPESSSGEAFVPAADPSLSSSSTSSAPTNRFPVELAVGGGVAGLGGGVVLLRRFGRNRPRICPNCGQKMVRLDEAADDVHLDSGQKLEEVLSSVDYDVWKCESCNATSVYPYPKLFSGNRECPSCHYKTMVVNSSIISHPTYSSRGEKEITSDCQQCSYHNRQLVSLPMLTRSTSSSSSSSSSSRSSGSFSGGSSSGGGATGSW